MNHKPMVVIGLFLAGGIAHAQIEPRVEPVALDSQYVPVNLSALANSHNSIDLPLAAGEVEKIPFDFMRSNTNNHLFLHRAGWPDWAKDPLDFYSEYDARPAKPTEELPVVQIPVSDYSAVYLLASCENEASYSNVLSLRIGAKDKMWQTTYRDFEFVVPRKNASNGKNVVKVIPTSAGNLFLLRLPLNAPFAQDFKDRRTLDLEITKQLRLAVSKPDAARFQYRPLGLPSGVRIYGMTFERAPLQMSLQGRELGNVFNQPSVPAFDLDIDVIRHSSFFTGQLTVKSKVVDYYGKVTEFEPQIIKPNRWSPGTRLKLEFPVKKRGYYTLAVTVESGGKVLLERKTTFALLPPDTRRYRAQNPFGVWDFGGSHNTPNQADMVGPLYVKAGLRYGMFDFSPAERERYGVLKGNDPTVNYHNFAKLDEQIQKVKESGVVPDRWLLFHEDAISGNHVTRTPDILTGKKYELNEEEKKKFARMVQIVEETVPKVRAAFPNIKFDLGNGVPHLMEEFLRSKLSPNLFDALGNEAAGFQRLPESQPTDFVANNASLWIQRKMLNEYGYGDKQLVQSYEIGYPSTNPGNLTLSEQANYVLRNAMHSLAWKIPKIRFEGIVDPGNSYYHSNWGGTGLMFALPHVSPKPLFVAVATMTQELDGAQFMRSVPTGTPTVYAFEFKRKNGAFVTCIWTPNKSRSVQLDASRQDNLIVTDTMSNQQTLVADKGRFTLLAAASPQFIQSRRPLRVSTTSAIPEALSGKQSMPIASFGSAALWQQDASTDRELSAYNFMQPRLAGRFEMKPVAEFENEKDVLELKYIPGNEPNWWLPRYTRLIPAKPVELAGRPTHLQVKVNGNGSWGRLVFELEDAAGQRWISLGTEQQGAPNPWLGDWMGKDELAKMQTSGVSDWNSNDVWGRSMINFEGWGTIKFPLPGNYEGEGYHWPYTSQWRCVKADGNQGDYRVHYPLKLTKLAVTARSKVLYGTEVLDVKRPSIYLKEIEAIQGNPDTDFWQPDAGQR